MSVSPMGDKVERQPSGLFALGESETESQWGSERPENSPVDCFQRRTGGSPGWLVPSGSDGRSRLRIEETRGVRVPPSVSVLSVGLNRYKNGPDRPKYHDPGSGLSSEAADQATGTCPRPGEEIASPPAIPELLFRSSF